MLGVHNVFKNKNLVQGVSRYIKYLVFPLLGRVCTLKKINEISILRYTEFTLREGGTETQFFLV